MNENCVPVRSCFQRKADAYITSHNFVGIRTSTSDDPDSRIKSSILSVILDSILLIVN